MRQILAVGAVLGLWLSSAVFAAAPPAPGAPPAQGGAAAGAADAKAAEAPTVETYYTADKLRDPFLSAQTAGAVKPKPAVEQTAAESEEFSIHNLSLRALMKDVSADYAFFTDPGSKLNYMLRKGKLFDPKNKPVPGVVGSIEIKKKTVTLTTPDKDVQIFRLGEDAKEKDADSNKAAAQAPAKAGTGG